MDNWSSATRPSPTIPTCGGAGNECCRCTRSRDQDLGSQETIGQVTDRPVCLGVVTVQFRKRKDSEVGSGSGAGGHVARQVQAGRVL